MSQMYRLPAAGSINNRVAATNILNSSSGFAGLGVSGLMTAGKAGGGSAKDQRFINCFSETIIDAISGTPSTYTVKRPGFEEGIDTLSAAIGTALLVWTGNNQKIISAFGGTNSHIYDSATDLGAITGRATGITETTVSGTATITITSSDNTAWYYDTTVPTKITDADFPGNAGKTLAGTFAHIDGYAVVMTTDGGIYASDLNSVTAWTATSYATANSYPDLGRGVVRHRNLIMAFGSESLEFWQNSGLTPFPLSRVANMTTKVGCVSADAITQISDVTFWCGSSPQGGLSVFQFDGTIGRISTPEIDQILILAGAGNITMTTCRFYGRSFVIVRAATATFVYCIEEKQWSEWASSAAPWFKVVGVSSGTTMVNYSISNSLTDGIVYTQNPASLTFKDAGESYSALIQLDQLDLGTRNRKKWESLAVIGDRQTGSEISLLWSDDDYATWTAWGTLDLSENLPIARRLGNSRRRAWALSHASNTPMRIRLLEGKATIGIN